MSRHEKKIILKNQLSELDHVRQSLEELSGTVGAHPKLMHAIDLSLDEVLTNIISYGYDDKVDHEIEVRVSLDTQSCIIEIEDDARHFNPVDLPEADTTSSLEERKVGGLGVHFVRTLMDEVEYKLQNNRNLLILKKRITED